MNIFESPTEQMNPTFIFVDGSYYCFYRYYSLINWWKNAHKDEPLVEQINNQVFVDKFRKIFVEHLQQMPKKLHIDKKVNPSRPHMNYSPV